MNLLMDTVTEKQLQILRKMYRDHGIKETKSMLSWLGIVDSRVQAKIIEAIKMGVV